MRRQSQRPRLVIVAQLADLSIGTKRAWRFVQRLSSMSPRAHFWLRVAALVAILGVQFGPRLWNGASVRPATGAKMAAAETR